MSLSQRLVKYLHVFLFGTWQLTGVVVATAATVEVEIRDSTPFHVFLSGSPFSFEVRPKTTVGETPDGLAYQWRDFRGNALGPVRPLTDRKVTTVNSPLNAPDSGYLGLAFFADDPDVMFNASSGSRSEIGFVALPEKSAMDRNRGADSPFGVVHADLDDPYLPPWVKTLTWNTAAPKYWAGEINRRQSVGLRELPLISGKHWVSDDESAVTAEFLVVLRKKFHAYISADPSIAHWELGREENLSRRYELPAYFPNLAAKAVAVREASSGVTTELRLLFQIGGRSLSDAKAFFDSVAAAEFDVFAPHPYVWPDFPTPEMWLDTFILERRLAMRKRGLSMPIWFTEIGAPQNDAGVRQMLSGNSPVRGQTRDENAAYVIKTNVISLANGVEKIFWYNYIDRDPSTTDVEDHFGLVDFWGFPKPSYAAFVAMVGCIGDKQFVARRDLIGGIRIYEFSNSNKKCLVAWVYPAISREIRISTVVPELEPDFGISATDSVGAPLQLNSKITLDGFPVFFTVSGDLSD